MTSQISGAGSLLAGMRGLVMGIANDRSIAWHIARLCAAHGAELAITYQGEGALQKRVTPLAEKLGSDIIVPCDVGKAGDVARLFTQIRQKWDQLDFVVHAVAYADKDALRGRFVDTTRTQFAEALDISCYSLVELAQYAHDMMKPGGSMVTLSYLGGERVVPHYNVMGIAKAALEMSVRYLAADLGKDGIRVNAVSAGPIKTLASSGIGDFRYILKWNEYNSPLRRNVGSDEVAAATLYLVSDLSSAVTGEVHHVDCGYHVVGMKMPEAPDIAGAG